MAQKLKDFAGKECGLGNIFSILVPSSLWKCYDFTFSGWHLIIDSNTSGETYVVDLSVYETFLRAGNPECSINPDGNFQHLSGPFFFSVSGQFCWNKN